MSMGFNQAFWGDRNRALLLWLSGLSVLLIAGIDWATKPYVSLGFLYLFPILACAAFLPRWAVALLALVCAILSALFSGLPPSFVRVAFETIALAGCGLFVHELSANQRLELANQEQLRVLIGTSPLAILRVGREGLIELVNDAAHDLLKPRDGQLLGCPIAAFVPELHYALRLEGGPQFRSALQCRIHRGDGGTFSAEVWFSTYLDGTIPKLAAIIADLTEDDLSQAEGARPVPEPAIELTAREQEILSLIVQGLANKEIAEKIQLSESAVKNTIQTLFSKSGVRSRSQLVRVALEQFRDVI